MIWHGDNLVQVGGVVPFPESANSGLFDVAIVVRLSPPKIDYSSSSELNEVFRCFLRTHL